MAARTLYVVGVFLLLVVRFSDKDLVIGLDNGLALTPPSKFLIWKMKLCGYGNFELMCLQAVVQ